MAETYHVPRSEHSNKKGMAILYRQHPDGNRATRRLNAKIARDKATELRRKARIKAAVEARKKAKDNAGS